MLLFVSAQIVAYGQEGKKSVKQKSLTQSNQIFYKSTPNSDGIIRCHTMEMDSIRRAQNPGMPSLKADEIWLQEKIQDYKYQQAAKEAAGLPKAALITIPIIFHIFTDLSGDENISAAVVQAQIDQLNLDYRNLAGSSFAVAGDIELEFCLAVVDESGLLLAEAGINRITSYDEGPFSSNDFDSGMKAATQWDPDDYFNVWVADLSGGLLGYAQFPSATTLPNMYAGGAANTDGVVILYSSMGSVANTFFSGVYNQGRTLTHETGHWLGLKHIWGDGGCAQDDDCDDTPKSDGSNYGCPSTNSCTDAYTSTSPWWPTANPSDMVENYMDYSDDACMNTFTEDQKTRVRTVMLNSPRRVSLTTSTVCQTTLDPDNAGISAITGATGDICGSTIDPIVTLYNYGNNNLTSVNISYDLDGGASTTINWVGNLASGATVDVVIPTISPSAGSHMFNTTTSLPNGNTDADPSNDANSSSFTIVIGGQLITLTLDTDCYGEETVWELIDATSTVIETGGNNTVTLPVTTTQTTSSGDSGAYLEESQYTIDWCLSPGCYDFVLWDAYGDGLNGSSVSGCSTDGDFEITDGGGGVLASLQAPNGTFTYSETNNFCVTSPCTSTFTSSTTEELCNGDDNGLLSVVFTSGNSSGATYNIGSGDQGSGVFNNLAQGSYTVTIIDGDACTAFVQVTLGGPAALVADMTVSNVSCNGQTDGHVVVTTTGGASVVTYDIGAGPVGSGIFNGLSAGSYTVNVIDGNGCAASTNGTVVEPTVLSATTGAISPELFGSDGSVAINVAGGTPNFTYAWTGTGGYISSSASPSNMPGGTYSVTVTDASGCTTTITGIIVPSQLGIDEFGNIQFMIYPNPSNGVFNVQLIDAVDYTLTVLDITGRIVYSKSNSSDNTFVVDLTDAANGTYMMSIQTDTQILTKRIVLKK